MPNESTLSKLSNAPKLNTMYDWLVNLSDDLIAIHNDIVSIANQLWYALPDISEESKWICAGDEKTISSEIHKIKTITEEIKARSRNVSENIK